MSHQKSIDYKETAVQYKICILNEKGVILTKKFLFVSGW